MGEKQFSLVSGNNIFSGGSRPFLGINVTFEQSTMIPAPSLHLEHPQRSFPTLALQDSTYNGLFNVKGFSCVIEMLTLVPLGISYINTVVFETYVYVPFKLMPKLLVDFFVLR